MPRDKHCCEAVTDYFRQLFCVSQVLNWFSAWIPSTEHPDASSTGTSSVSISENNNAPITITEYNRFQSCEECDLEDMRGSQRKQTKELPADVVRGYSTMETNAIVADEASSLVTADEASTPSVEKCEHFLNWASTVNTCTPSTAGHEPEDETTDAMGKQNTYPPGTETNRRTPLTQKFWQFLTQRTQERSGSPVSRPTARSAEGAGTRRRRGRDVMILRGYRDIMPLIRPPVTKASGCLSVEQMLERNVDNDLDSPVDSQSSSSSEDCPPWLPQSDQCSPTASTAATASEYAPVQRQPTYHYASHRGTHPQLAEQSIVGKNRETPVTAGCSSKSVGDHQRLPVTIEEEEEEEEKEESEVAGVDGRRRDTSPEVVLGRNAVRFTRWPSGQGASTDGGVGQRRLRANADGWQSALAPTTRGQQRGMTAALPLPPPSAGRCGTGVVTTRTPYCPTHSFEESWPQSFGAVANTSLRRRIHVQKQRVESQRGSGPSQHPGGSTEHC